MTSVALLENRKEKKLKNKRKSSDKKDTGIGMQISSGGSRNIITDVNMELHPIGYYINDREEMINQMFSAMKPEKLRAMLPPILKGSSIEELKTYCLEELQGMTCKHINRILEGRELHTSESEIESSDTEYMENVSFPVNTKNQRCNDTGKIESYEIDLEESNKDDANGSESYTDVLEIGITSKEQGDLLNYMTSSKKSENKRHAEDLEPSASCNKKGKCESKEQLDAENVKQRKNNDEDEFVETLDSSDKKSNIETGSVNVGNAESKGKTLLEILELEMRARAIRALLKQDVGLEEGKGGDSGNNEP